MNCCTEQINCGAYVQQLVNFFTSVPHDLLIISNHHVRLLRQSEKAKSAWFKTELMTGFLT